MLNDEGLGTYHLTIIPLVSKIYFSFLEVQADELW